MGSEMCIRDSSTPFLFLSLLEPSPHPQANTQLQTALAVKHEEKGRSYVELFVGTTNGALFEGEAIAANVDFCLSFLQKHLYGPL